RFSDAWVIFVRQAFQPDLVRPCQAESLTYNNKKSPSFGKEGLKRATTALDLPAKACPFGDQQYASRLLRPWVHGARRGAGVRAVNERASFFGVLTFGSSYLLRPSHPCKDSGQYCSFRRRSQWRGRAGFSPASLFSACSSRGRLDRHRPRITNLVTPRSWDKRRADQNGKSTS